MKDLKKVTHISAFIEKEKKMRESQISIAKSVLNLGEDFFEHHVTEFGKEQFEKYGIKFNWNPGWFKSPYFTVEGE
jgi:hypothetical protein